MIKNTVDKIFFIDDDASMRRAITLLLQSAGYKIETFKSVREFLSMESFNGTGCILLDIFIKDESGLELQKTIADKFKNLPIIYLSGHADIPMSVLAFKKGAINFLQKPVDEQQLFAALEEAICLSHDLQKAQHEKAGFKELIDCLTQREFEIFRLLITGLLNKEIAAKLNIAEHTVKLHRGKITEKLGVKSVAEMFYMAKKLNIEMPFKDINLHEA